LQRKGKGVAQTASSAGLLDELKNIIADVNLNNEEPDKDIKQASILVKAFFYGEEEEYRRVAGYMMKVGTKHHISPVW